MKNIYIIASREFCSRVKDPLFLKLMLFIPLGISVAMKVIQKYTTGDSAGGGVAPQEYILGYCGSYMIFFAIVMFGSQVMKSVTEEKSSKLVEILLSSVKPFELLVGKIMGVGLSGLFQFLGWILLSGFSVTMLGSFKFESVLSFFSNGTAVISFLLYFILGYLLYSAVFAALAATTDSSTDTQQLILPIVAPLFISLLLKNKVLAGPDSSLSVWLSNLPFTSPIIMLNRIAAGSVSVWQVIISLACLLGGIIVIAYLAGKIYRTKILTQGSKFGLFSFFKA